MVWCSERRTRVGTVILWFDEFLGKRYAWIANIYSVLLRIWFGIRGLCHDVIASPCFSDTPQQRQQRSTKATKTYRVLKSRAETSRNSRRQHGTILISVNTNIQHTNGCQNNCAWTRGFRTGWRQKCAKWDDHRRLLHKRCSFLPLMSHPSKRLLSQEAQGSTGETGSKRKRQTSWQSATRDLEIDQLFGLAVAFISSILGFV
jgi:hypothetical protein